MGINDLLILIFLIYCKKQKNFIETSNITIKPLHEGLEGIEAVPRRELEIEIVPNA